MATDRFHSALRKEGKARGGSSALWRVLSRALFCVLFGASLSGCSEPPPLIELEQVDRIEKALWNTGAKEFAPEEYLQYQERAQALKETFSRERARWSVVREYDEIRNHLTSLSSEGEILLQSVSLKKNKTRESAVEEVRSVEMLADRLREQSEKLFLTRPARKKAVQAELLLGEARHDIDEGRYRAAREQAKRARTLLEPAEREINATLNRYLERKNVVRWRRWVRETLDWSRKNAAPVIVVRKAERTLTLYQGERPIKVYPINLGFNGLNDKRSVGDGATPEGAYRVILKKDLGETKYHRALLINYPNERDRTRIKRAKRLGGLIEIHGGRNEGLEETLGCVALDNDQMDDLFSRVPNGTPVTIVGTTNDLTSTDFAL